MDYDNQSHMSPFFDSRNNAPSNRNSMAMSVEANYSIGGNGSIASPVGRAYTPQAMSPTSGTPNPYLNRQRADSTTSSAYYNNSNVPRFSQSSAELLTRDVTDQDYQYQQPQQHAQSPRAMTPGSAGAGYNPSSFIFPGREAPVKGLHDDRPPLLDEKDFNPHEEGWDVYSDFNNAGPRYSTAFPSPISANSNGGYQQLPVGAAKVASPSTTANTPVELVTVPALGAEWGKEELRAMTKSGKREVKREKWASRWRSLRREEHGFLGTGLSRTKFVFILFGICCAIGIVLAFTIPRVPNILVNASTPLSGGSNIVFSRTPTNFSFDVNLNLQIDTHSTFVPVTFSSFDAVLLDSSTGKSIATGHVSSKTFAANKFLDFSFPITFNYTAVNQSDMTWNDIYNACRNPATEPDGQARPPIAFSAELFMSIIGLVKKQATTLKVSSAPCPFELPVNSV